MIQAMIALKKHVTCDSNSSNISLFSVAWSIVLVEECWPPAVGQLRTFLRHANLFQAEAYLVTATATGQVWEILQLRWVQRSIIALSLGLAVAVTITQTRISMDFVLRRKFKPLTSVSDFAMFFGKATYYISCHTMEVYPWNRFKLHRTIKVSNCSQSCLDIQPPRISPKQSRMVVQPVQPHKNHHELSATHGCPLFIWPGDPGFCKKPLGDTQESIVSSAEVTSCLGTNGTIQPAKGMITRSRIKHPETWWSNGIIPSGWRNERYFETTNKNQWHVFIYPSWTNPRNMG